MVQADARIVDIATQQQTPFNTFCSPSPCNALLSNGWHSGIKNSALSIQPWQPDADPLMFYIDFLFSTLLLGSSYYSLPHFLKKIMPHTMPHRKALCLSRLIYNNYEHFRHGLYKVLKSLQCIDIINISTSQSGLNSWFHYPFNLQLRLNSEKFLKNPLHSHILWIAKCSKVHPTRPQALNNALRSSGWVSTNQKGCKGTGQRFGFADTTVGYLIYSTSWQQVFLNHT